MMIGRLSVIGCVFVGLVWVCSPRTAVAESGPIQSPSRARILHFPTDRSLGRLMIRQTKPQLPEVFHNWSTFEEMESLGQAQGTVTVPAGYEVALIVERPESWRDLSPLRQFRPDDLYRLDIRGSYFGGPKPGDACMPHVACLTGLRVLDLGNTSITSAGMQHATALKNLQWLRPPPLLDDAGMAHIAQLPSLTNLYLSENRLTNAALQHLSKLGSLTELCLGGGRITDDGLVHLAQVPQLRFLMLWGKGFTNGGFARLKDIPKLEALNLGGFEWVGDAGLAHLAEIPGLQEIDLYHATRITDNGVAYLKKLRNLRKLTINDSQVTDAGLAHVKEIKMLESLSLPGKDITDVGFRHLAQLTRLRDLSATRPHYVDPNMNKNYYTDDGLKAVSGLTSLEKLSLGSIGITDAGIQYLGRLTRLQYLDLFGCDRITDEALKTIGQLRSLETLTLYKGRLTISGLKALNGLTRLKNLDVAEVIQDNSSLDISGLKNLEKLTIGTEHRSPAVLRDEDLACLAGLPRLRWFQISQAVNKPHALTDRGLAHLSGLVNMNRLTLGGPSLTDESLAYFTGMKKLDMLNIYGGRFTDRGLAKLEQLNGLANLTLIGDHSFSQAGIRHLFETLPELNNVQIGPKFPGQRILRAKVLAGPSGVRPGTR